MEKSYLAMDDGEKAAAEAENAMMLARVNFMVAMASALVPKDRNKINEQLVNSNWRMVCRPLQLGGTPQGPPKFWIWAPPPSLTSPAYN